MLTVPSLARLGTCETTSLWWRPANPPMWLPQPRGCG